jgi:MOSC domain-containing protein YiiM
MTPSSAQVVSVNVGRIESFDHHDRTVTTAITKRPVAGRVATVGVNLVGDDQADRSVHGGPDRALYAYAAEDLEWWSATLGRALGPGSMGENLTTSGIDVTGATIGERWRIGTLTLEVTAPRVPCFKLGIRMGDARFPQRFARAGRPGAYLRIVEHGDIAAGDPIVVGDRPDHGVTVALVARAFHDDHSLAGRLLAAPQLGAGWPEWARRHAA